MTAPPHFQPAAGALYGFPGALLIAAAPDEATLAARAQARGLAGPRFYAARLHAALLAAPQMARDKLGKFLQL